MHVHVSAIPVAAAKIDSRMGRTGSMATVMLPGHTSGKKQDIQSDGLTLYKP